MKKVCQKCGGKKLHKHGKKRRKCADCGATCTIQSGRKRSKFYEMYVLDRSTMRRISTKTKRSAPEVMRKIMDELEYIPIVSSITKKFSLNQSSLCC